MSITLNRHRARPGRPLALSLPTVLAVLVATLIPLAGPASAQAGGGNVSCPSGQALVAKFNLDGDYRVEVGDAVSVIGGSEVGGSFSSTVAIGTVIVKGGTDAKAIPFSPPVLTGTFDNAGLVNGGGRTPAISNVTFCQGAPAAPPVVELDVCPNLDGTQVVVPDGMVVDLGGRCVTPPVVVLDVCPNLDGTQAVVPEGMLVDLGGRCVTPPPVEIDLCGNFPGTQTVVPDGMVVEDGYCVTSEAPVVELDVCGNLPGTQTVVPDGMVVEDGYCVTSEAPVDELDVCGNRPGTQAVVPEGMVVEDGYCVIPEAPVVELDVCPNLDGTQAVVPEGMLVEDGYCVTPDAPAIELDVCPNLDGTQAVVPEGMLVDLGGRCVTPSVVQIDVCPNLDGTQAVVPDGMVVEDGSCVTPQPQQPIMIDVCSGLEGACVTPDAVVMVDACTNLEGTQAVVPAEMVTDGSGGCETVAAAVVSITLFPPAAAVIPTPVTPSPVVPEAVTPAPVPVTAVPATPAHDGIASGAGPFVPSAPVAARPGTEVLGVQIVRQPAGRSLPRTGADSTTLATVAAALLLAGVVLTGAGRQRSGQRPS